MERRFEVRKEALLADCEVDVKTFAGALGRLERFVQPYAACLHEAEQQQHTHAYVQGLLSDLKRKNGEAIAYLHDEERKGVQHFIGAAPWNDEPLLLELANQVGREIGEADGVLVFDPSGFAKKGQSSVGVARQWLGRLGKVDNGQVAVYLGYVSRQEHALVDRRLYLPAEWTTDRRRCTQAGVPKDRRRLRTRHDLALEMLDGKGPLLPHAWIAGDDEMGRSTRFRRDLQARSERYLLMVPSNTLIRDREAPPPPYGGRGRHPKTPWTRLDRWAAALPSAAWTRLEVRAGEKGPLVVEAVKRRVAAKTDRRREGPEEILVIVRSQEDDGTWKHDYALSNAPLETPLAEYARVAKAEHRIEECLQRAKSEAGLADYQVRNWLGWHHHQTLALLATWFLVQETRLEKKIHSGNDGPTSANTLGWATARSLRGERSGASGPRVPTAFTAQRTRPVPLLEKTP